MKRALSTYTIPEEEHSEEEDSFNGFDDTDDDAVSMLSKRFKFSGSSDDGKRDLGVKKVNRKPTRQPDPKITNRNALMARENRRKNKEKLSLLEQQNERLFEKNALLERQLQLKDAVIKDLRREMMHLKSVIANKTQISSILTALQASGVPIRSSSIVPTSVNVSNQHTSTTEKITKEREMSPLTECSSGYESPTLTSSCENYENDYEMDTNALAVDSWGCSSEATNGIFPDLSPEMFEDDNFVPSKQDNYSEHNYSEPGDADPGVCLHISNQKVSIEFCGRCHANATTGKDLLA